MNKQELKVKIIKNRITRPKTQEVLDFVNENNIKVVSILDDRDCYQIFYYDE